ncbi:MAG: alpha-amylase family glycosyl hydrolase [Promethearchaeia archaeon]
MKVIANARKKYELDDSLFNEKGNIIFEGNIYNIRQVVRKINEKKDLISYPEQSVRAGLFSGMALEFEINDYFFDLYQEEMDFNVKKELYSYLNDQIGEDQLEESLKILLEKFPPKEIYNDELTAEQFIEKRLRNSDEKADYIEEIVKLRIANDNSAFSDFQELFNDEEIEEKISYEEIIETADEFFEQKPGIGSQNQSLIELLKTPIKKHPKSIPIQLKYMRDNWSNILGKYYNMILTALDLISEEERLRGLGPGKARVYEYDVSEIENYTADKEWMPKVVMIAKNTYVWLHQLSKKYGRSIKKLNEIPDEELDKLRDWGFNALWLIGVWERCQASKQIKRWCGNPEAEASAYSLYDYEIAYDLGGHDAYENLRDRATQRGIRLASDMVPNHTGIVSKWTLEHPNWYISLQHPPFPSYQYSGKNLAGRSDVGIYLEDKYFTREDAAVTFKRVDFNTGDTKYIYHGNDGTSFPWNDTAQLNFLKPEVREAVIQKILHVSRLFPIIRFDAAMTLTRKHFQRLWFPEPGSGGAIPSRAEHGMSKEEFYEKMPEEFWREVVERIKKENPDTLLLAEAFWLLEGFFVRTLGMHRVYNSAFMNMLSDEDNAKYRAVLKNTLEFDRQILKRFVNFMSNPDEEPAIIQFGDGDKYFGVCVLMVTMPGLPMFGHGQIQGYSEKYGMEYRRAYWEEEINWGLLHHHERLIFPLMKKRYLFADVKNFILYDFWTGNTVNEDVFAYSNMVGTERALIVYNNRYNRTNGYVKSSVGYAVKEGDEKKIIQRNLAEGLNIPQDGYTIFEDHVTGLEYIRRNNEIKDKGLFFELNGYQIYVLLNFRIIQDNKFSHYAKLYDHLGGKGVPDIHETLNSVIYQPLYEPLEQIINPEVFKELSASKGEKSVIQKIKDPLNLFLNKVNEYSSGRGNMETVKDLILKKVKIFLNLKNHLEKLNFSEENKKYISKILPKSKFELTVAFSWAILHLIGMVQTDEEEKINMISRSWIDSWKLSKFIQETLFKLQEEGKENIQDYVKLIKLLVDFQDWAEDKDLDDQNASKALESFLKDAEINEFLQINRYENKLWFSADAYELFTKWWAIVALVNGISAGQKSALIEKRLSLTKRWQAAEKKSEYKIKKLLRLLKKKD